MIHEYIPRNNRQRSNLFKLIYYTYQISFCIQLYYNTILESFSVFCTILYNISLVYYEWYMCRSFDTEYRNTTVFRSKKNIPFFNHLLQQQHTCSICLELLNEKSVCGRFCTHLYHGECIFPWYVTQGTCPLCRHYL